MDNVFIDTNVAFDIISKRQPFFDDSNKILELSINNSINLLISEGSVYTLIYLTYDSFKIPNAETLLSDFISSCTVVFSQKKLLINSINSSFKDKEDACQYFTALHNDANYFITRNKKDYQPYASAIPIYTPSEFLENFE